MHLKKSFAVTLFATVALLATSAQAQPTDVHVTSIVDPLPELEGWVTNRISIDFSGPLTGVQMWLDGDAELFNEATLGRSGLGPGSSALFATFPQLEFDSFVTFGGFAQDDPDALPPGISGAAANIGQLPGFEGADSPAAFGGTGTPPTAEGLNIATFTPAGGAPVGGTDYPVAQLTLSNETNGTLHLFAAAGGMGFDGTPVGQPSTGHVLSLPVVNGVVAPEVVIPEPSTIVLLGLGLVGLVALKRRNG